MNKQEALIFVEKCTDLKKLSKELEEGEVSACTYLNFSGIQIHRNIIKLAKALEIKSFNVKRLQGAPNEISFNFNDINFYHFLILPQDIEAINYIIKNDLKTIDVSFFEEEKENDFDIR